MLQDFITEVKSRGLARTNRYLVRIPMPFADSDQNRLTEMMCDSVQLPGMTIATTPHNFWGEVREMPYGRSFDNVTLSFYLDTEMHTKKVFDQWMALIQNPTTRTLNYYDNYVTQVEIDVLDLEKDSVMYSVKLFEAYPKTINAIQLDSSDKNIMKLTVVLNYKYFTTSSMEEQNQDERVAEVERQAQQDRQNVSRGEGFTTATPATSFPRPAISIPKPVNPFRGQGGKFGGIIGGEF